MPRTATVGDATFEVPRNVTRLDYETTAEGWWVRLYRSPKGAPAKLHSKTFYDNAHGGPEGALEAAVAWRDSVVAEHGPPRVQDAAHLQTPEMRRKAREAVRSSGVTGIHLVWKQYNTDEEFPYVSAYWVDEAGRRRQTGFSAVKHGLEGAVSLAARARAQTTRWFGEEPMTAVELRDAVLPSITAQYEREVHR